MESAPPDQVRFQSSAPMARSFADNFPAAAEAHPSTCDDRMIRAKSFKARPEKSSVASGTESASQARLDQARDRRSAQKKARRGRGTRGL
jgi:hypothetical protein